MHDFKNYKGAKAKALKINLGAVRDIFGISSVLILGYIICIGIFAI